MNLDPLTNPAISPVSKFMHFWVPMIILALVSVLKEYQDLTLQK